MKQRKLIIRIVALFMAVLMGLSVFAIFFKIFGADGTTFAVAATGSQASDTNWPIYAALAAMLIIIVVIVIPKVIKKK